MMKSFISLATQNLLSITDGALKDIVVVFPNRRAGATFRQELINQITTPSWSPGIFSIDDWLVGLSGLKTTDRLTELALLFPIVQQEIPLFLSFSDFMDFGEILLTEFDDIDKYLVDPQQLFSAVREVKQIDNQFDVAIDPELVERIRLFWDSFGLDQSIHRENWLQTWDKLLQIYTQFHKNLAAHGWGTSGMCYRKVAEGFVNGTVGLGRYKSVAFMGFNILTTAEETIFDCLKNNHQALFYWDYHPFYLAPSHEAGRFIRQYLHLFQPPAGFQPFVDENESVFNPGESRNTIKVVPVTSNTGQVQGLLNEIQCKPAGKRGIILSDEHLFTDLLSSWPDDSLAVNFTSGYPLRDTQAASFFSSMIAVYLEVAQYPDKPGCRSEVLMSLLRHPWVKCLTDNESDTVCGLIQRRFPEWVPADFFKMSGSWLSWISTKGSTDEFLDQWRNTGKRVQQLDNCCSCIEKAAIESILSEIDVMDSLIKKFSIQLNARAISKLFTRYIHATKIPLETDRDAPNQVMGVLETRSIDFDEVYILSFNEGIWPSKNLPISLIPYSMRRFYHLPTAENRDAMYAYHFYRLIQRSQATTIYYLTGHQDDAIRSGEKSRYITQLQFELPSKIHFELEPPARIGKIPKPISINQIGMVHENLSRYLSDGLDAAWLSPSAINEYLDCSLKFALKRIYGFNEPDEIAYASDPRGFGTLIHQVMNTLYRNFVGTNQGPDQTWFQQTISNSDALSKLILSEYKLILKETGETKPGGKELIAMEVISQWIKKIMEIDQHTLSLNIVGLEQKVDSRYPIGKGEQKHQVNLFGIIDRLDQISTGTRIIDYKTGNCELNIRNLEDVFDPSLAKRPKEVFQVLLYCELYQERNPARIQLLPGLFRLGKFRAGETDYRVKISGKEVLYDEIRGEFNERLTRLLEEIFNPDVPFVQTNNEQLCLYCPYSGICSRGNYS